MKSLLKWVGILLGVIVALAVLLSVAVSIFFDPNDYRDEIAAAVQEQTGRTLSIDGDLSLQSFPCCGVSLGPLALSNPPEFPDSQFASVEKAAVSVRLLPLILAQELQIGDVELTGLNLQLISKNDGTVNWEFGESTAPAEPVPDETAGGDMELAGVGVAGVAINGGRIVYIDEAAGDRIELRDISINTNEITFGDTFNLSASVQAEGLAPGLSSAVALDSEVVLNEDLSVTLSNTQAELQLTGADLPGGEAGMVANIGSVTGVGSEQLELGGLDIDVDAAGLRIKLAGQGSVDAGTPALAGTLELERFSPRELLATIGEPVPVTADPAVLQAVAVSADWQFKGDSAALENFRLTLDDSTAVGWLRIASLEKQSIALDLQFDTLDADRYLAPVEEADGGSSTSTSADDDTLDLPVEDIRALDVQGRLGFGQLKFSDARLSDVNINLLAKDGLVRLNPLTAALYAGSYSGDVRLDVRGAQPKLSVNEKLNNIQIDGLLKDTSEQANLAGIATASITATASGDRISELIKNLTGDASINMDEGKYLGVDLWYEIRKARALLKKETPPDKPANPYTEISEFSGTAQFKDGILSNKDLRGQIPFIRLGGSGTVNLLESLMDYRLEARVVSRPQFDGRTLDDLQGVTLPVTLKGPLESPKVNVDIGAVAVSVGKAKLLDRLNKKFGGDDDEKSDSDEAKQEGEEKSESSRDQLKRGLRDLLGN